MSNRNFLYYSINTELAYRINEDFYGGKHYVWCSHIFDPTTASRYSSERAIGSTSNPHDIYCDLFKHVHSRDNHSPKIDQNRTNLKRGASIQLKNNVISLDTYGIITHIIESAEKIEFTPLIYVIQAANIAPERIKRVHPKYAATLIGPEFQIEDLRSEEFDVIGIKPW
jgi:hypothetical protein